MAVDLFPMPKMGLVRLVIVPRIACTTYPRPMHDTSATACAISPTPDVIANFSY